MPTFCLARHADYRCQHSGACCTSNWPIHIEAERLDSIGAAIAGRRLTVPHGAAFDVPPDLPPGAGAVLRTTVVGACVFYDGAARRCRVHGELGHEMLPSACQHFPRRCLIERDAVCVSLSHYCPTVARMAFDEGAARGIVSAPGSLVGHLHLEGLDATDALPPLLRPGVLTDLEGFHAWERAAVELLEAGEAPELALERVARMTTRVSTWSPGKQALAKEVAAADPHARAEAVTARIAGADGRAADELAMRAAWELVRRAIPEEFRRGDAPPLRRPVLPGADLAARDARWVAPTWTAFSGPLCRFLAAHAFGSWCGYLGDGLNTVARSLEVALAIVRAEAGRLCDERAQSLDQAMLVEAFRAADLLLVHLADPKALATAIDKAPRGFARG